MTTHVGGPTQRPHYGVVLLRDPKSLSTRRKELRNSLRGSVRVSLIYPCIPVFFKVFTLTGTKIWVKGLSFFVE